MPMTPDDILSLQLQQFMPFFFCLFVCCASQLEMVFMNGQKSHLSLFWRQCLVFPVAKETFIADLLLIVVKSDIDCKPELF